MIIINSSKYSIQDIFSSFLDNSLDIIYIFDINGKFIDINDIALKLFEYNREELFNKSFVEILDKGQDEKFFTLLDNLKANVKKSNYINYKVNTKNGNIILLDTYTIPIMNNNLIAIINISKIISNKDHIYKDSNRHEFNFSNIFDHIPVGFHLYSLNAKDQLILKDSNPAANEILGIDSSKLLLKPIEEIFISYKESDILKRYINIAKNGGIEKWDHIEYHLDAIEGAYEIIAFQSSPNNIVVSFVDITKRITYEKKLEESESELRNLSEELENKISRRTKELYESEELYRNLFENIPNAIILMDMNKNFLITNPAFNKNFGYKGDEFIGKNIQENCFCTEPSLKKISDSLLKIEKDKKPVMFEAEIYRKDNTIAKIFVQLNLIEFEELELILLIIQDISNLKFEQEKAKLYLETAGVIIVALDKKGNINLLNKKGCEVLEYEQNELIGKNWFNNCIPINYRDKIKKIFEDIIENKNVNIEFYESPIISKSGKEKIIAWHNTILYDNNNDVLGTLSSGEDVTERKKMEVELRESEIIYRKLFESHIDGIIMMDLNGMFIDANKTFLDMSEYKLAQLKKFSIFDITPEKWYDDIKTIIDSKSKTLSREFDIELKKENGTIIPINLKLWTKTDIYNEPSGFWAIIRDISKKKQDELLQIEFRKRLEKEVKKRTKELNKALEKQRLFQSEIIKASKFKSEFLATMSHELRTPLNAIIGFTELMLDESFGTLNKEQYEYMMDIKTSAEHQYDMISSILNITQIESGQVILNKQQFSINTIIDQVISTIKPMYTKKKIQFIVEGLESDIKILADPLRIREILINLLTNAIKFTIEGKVKLIIKELFDKWVFKVRDEGIGIAQEDFDIIFRDFSRVDSAYVRSTPGTGLGLSLTKRLVELHNGTINFTSVLGVGTTFTFTIPKPSEEYDLDSY